MDIQNNQTQELFEKLYVKNAPSWALERDSDGSYKYHATQSAFSLFEQQQAEIELLKSDRNHEVLELIDQRDYMEDQAEQLKDKLQELYGVDFGEHSSCNFPFQNAINYNDSDLVLVSKDTLNKALNPNDYDEAVCSANELLAVIEAQEPVND